MFASLYPSSGVTNETSFLELWHETMAFLKQHPNTIRLVSATAIQDLKRARYNYLRTLQRSAQRSFRHQLISLLSARAGLIVHSAGLSQQQLRRLRQSLSDGGALPSTSLGVTIPPLLPSRTQVRASDEAAIAAGEIAHLKIVHDGDLTWGFEPLVVGIIVSNS